MAAANPSLHFFPSKLGNGSGGKALLAPVQLLLLPVRDRNIRRVGGQIVPQIFHQLELLRRSKVEDGNKRRIHLGRMEIA